MSPSPSDFDSSTLIALGEQAREAARQVSLASDTQKNDALQSAAAAISHRTDQLLDANQQDMQAAHSKGMSAAMLDRLELTKTRIDGIASSLQAISQLKDPVGRILTQWQRPNGLKIQRVATPLGVVGVIFESRPNVTADAGALCLKSGNAVILRGGSDAFHSSAAIHHCLQIGLADAGLPPAGISLVPTVDREAVALMLAGLGGNIDVMVPRGGRSLVERVQSDSRVPVFAHLEGICHVYVHHSADVGMAIDVVVNSKMRRTGICGAAETLLVDQACLDTHLLPILSKLAEQGCEIRGDEQVCDRYPQAIQAGDDDWRTEYLAPILSVRVVADLSEAIDHIQHFSSGHTEAIVASESTAADAFLREVDSAIVLHNASTQFADGGEFGMGAEIGIATGRFHARGPIGVEQLTTFKYRVHGSGHQRP